MSAARLREAAALMRERAEAATSGPWSAGDVTPGDFAERIPAYCDVEPLVAGGIDPHDAEHIASWHPAVALAVADWLDATAAENDSAEGSPLEFLNFVGADALAAIAVADAYLGGPRG